MVEDMVTATEKVVDVVVIIFADVKVIIPN
jgi:hypothetical protein